MNLFDVSPLRLAVLAITCAAVAVAALARAPATASQAPADGAAALDAIDGYGRASGAPDTSGYPPPGPSATPAPTATPDSAGLYPPPPVPYEIIAVGASPHGDLLALLDDALSAGDDDTLSAWASDGGAGLSIEYPTESEGFGTRLPVPDLAALLDELFSQGSEPVIQGYFHARDCEANGGPEQCWPIVITTGWQGPVAMPTKAPGEVVGPNAPDNLPLGAAAWELAPDIQGPYWTAWWLGDGYHALVEEVAGQGNGTYYVLR